MRLTDIENIPFLRPHKTLPLFTLLVVITRNTCDFCFLLKYLFDLPMRVDIVTDDDDQRIDTILDVDNQRRSLKELAEKYTSIRRKDYFEWRARLENEITKANKK